MTREEAISRLSDIRAGYSCFDDDERPKYHALSMAIQSLSAERTGECEKCHNQKLIKAIENRSKQNRADIRIIKARLDGDTEWMMTD